MTFDPNDILRRFHRVLVREIQATNPEHLTSPFSVAEIYQNLVPYRTHRDELGVEMNADYEHALLRLLSGEMGYLAIESKTAQREILEELESPNPNTGLYRDFAAADVRLNPELIDEALMWDPGSGEGAPSEGLEGEEAPREPDLELEEVAGVAASGTPAADEGLPEEFSEMDIPDPYSRAVVTTNAYRHAAKSLIPVPDDFDWQGDAWICPDPESPALIASATGPWPATHAMYELAGFDKTKLDAWNQSFQGRTAFKWMGFLSTGIVSRLFGR